MHLRYNAHYNVMVKHFKKEQSRLWHVTAAQESKER